MKREPPSQQLSDANDVSLNYRSAQGLSSRMIESYKGDLLRWLEFQGDCNFTLITSQAIHDYLKYLRFDYQPRRITAGNKWLC